MKKLGQSITKMLDHNALGSEQILSLYSKHNQGNKTSRKHDEEKIVHIDATNKSPSLLSLQERAGFFNLKVSKTRLYCTAYSFTILRILMTALIVFFPTNHHSACNYAAACNQHHHPNDHVIFIACFYDIL